MSDEQERQMKNDKMTDRERILTNIAAILAIELEKLQMLPEVRRYMASPHSISHVLCEWDLFNKKPFAKGELVVCRTSTGIQQNPWLISFVHEQGIPHDPHGLCLRAIGTDKLCNYGNESYVRVVGIHEKFLWEGDKQSAATKIHKALRSLLNYGHRFRGIEFDKENTGIAYVYIGEVFGGGLGKQATKPYKLTVSFTKKTTIKAIAKQMKEQGCGTREFEPEDGNTEGPQNPKPITRDGLIQSIEASGIELKDSVK